MFDYQTLELMHSHGDERFPMTEKEHHDAAEHDPEQGWRQGVRIFRCTSCDEEMVVVPPDQDLPGTGPG